MKYIRDSRQIKSPTLRGWEFIVSASPEGEDSADAIISLYSKAGAFALATNGDPVREGESPDGDELITALRDLIPAKMGRPLMGSERRQLVSVTVDAATLAAIEADTRDGESRGQVIDRWAADRAPKARQYRITANGADMGVYEGTTADEALDAYARDAGYRDYADALTVTSDDARAVEIKG